MNFPKSILIVRTDRIGDVVLSLPIASIIKKHSPGTRVAFLLSEYTKPLAEGNQFIDEILTVKKTNGRFSFYKNLILLKEKGIFSKNRFETSVVAYPTFNTALVLFLAGISTRIGTSYRWYSFLFNARVQDHRKSAERHELEYNIRLLRRLGIDEKTVRKNILFGITPADKSVNLVRHGLSSYGITFSNPLVIVHPGSGGSSIDLPVRKLKRILEIISKENIDIVVTGTVGEKELCASLVVNKNIINRAGEYNLEQLIALISSSDILIANSTGPIHIAAALGKYVVGFYPKIAACSAERWGPYTEKKIIFSPSIGCINCTRKQCVELNCMESIDEYSVAAGIIELLNNFVSEKKTPC
jgi:heptosyltransferase III